MLGADCAVLQLASFVLTRYSDPAQIDHNLVSAVIWLFVNLLIEDQVEILQQTNLLQFIGDLKLWPAPLPTNVISIAHWAIHAILDDAEKH